VQKTKKTGLPENLDMRHDTHFVDLIASRTSGPRIRMIATERIDPNPQQPRSELGNMQELMASIKSKGILEPIIVRPKGMRYEIIAGERRFVAAKKLALVEIPCIEMNVKDNEAMEISLIENLQRKDLGVFEEADGLKSLVENYGYSHNQISEKLGRARSTITEIISISKIPDKIRDICRKYGISSRSTILEIAKLKNANDMEMLIFEITNRSLTREDTRELSKKIKGKIKGIKRFVYNYSPKDNDAFRLRIEFNKQTVDREEIIRILEEVIKHLKSGPEK
jgi:ParB family chromosome partitioning protein